MEWVADAEEYIGKFGWGARGRNLGVSRMFGEGDKVSLSRNGVVAAIRPRGVLSGFLAIVPNTGVVYIPPIAAKVQPQRMRLRISDSLRSEGAIFSAYLTRDSPRRCVIEDILVWKGEAVWNKRTFSDRWNNLMSEFAAHHFRSDPSLQGFVVELAKYVSVHSLTEPSEKDVLELVPEAAGVKRFIWMPPRPPAASFVAPSAPGTSSTTVSDTFSVLKEVGMGPDVYAVYRGETRLGLALVRTLAVSKALRSAAGSVGQKARIRAEHNKTFDKYEVLEVIADA
jgi:hypothetical protein